MRRIFIFALTALVTVFLLVLLAAPAAHAADASWNGSNLSYQGKSYTKQTADGSNPPTLAKGTTYYRNIGTPDPLSGSGTIGVIYFPNTSDQTSAKYLAFQMDGSGKFGNKTADQSITVAKQVTIPAGSASWTGDNITYQSHSYTGAGSDARTSTGGNPDLPAGTKYYQYTEDPGISGSGTVHIIYFDKDTDPRTAKTAHYVTYSLGGDLKWSNKSADKSIPIVPAADSASTDGQADSASTCKVDGIGWIVCPVSNFLAQGMDNIFKLLEGFLVVKPLTTTTGSLFKAWSVMRNFANVAFVIAFIILIYSQLTSLGVSNYGIKKMLPRLIVSAILVNVSYWLCAIAVDLSNIVGSSLEHLLVALRTSIQGPNTNSLGSWQSVTGFILSGGALGAAAVAGGVIAISATGASIGAAIILLLPMLLSLLLAVLVALVVLAARQALITLLIIAAPLAFVAYLLPNTEKWFNKWRETLTTLLIFFPMFALVFGGSQLAAFLIIQNTDQINIVLLGMFVQVAPLVLTPLLVKFSGSVVGRVAGMVNNPNKGLIDRTRKWSKDRSELMAARNMGRVDPVRRHQPFRRMALGLDSQRRSREAQKTAYGAQSDARWTNSVEYSDIDQQLRRANETKQLGESRSELRYQTTKSINGALQNLDIEVRDAKLRLENAKLATDINWERNHDPVIAEQKLRAHTSADTIAALKATHDAAYDEFKAGDISSFPVTAATTGMLHQNQIDVETLAVQAARSANAKRAQQENYTTTVAADMDPNATPAERAYAQMIRQAAGGIQGHVGAQRALAQALADQRKSYTDSITNANAIIEHSNLSAAETLQVSKNISVKNIVVTEDIREAAAMRVAGGGVMPHIEEMLKSVDMSPTGNEHLRTAIVDSLRKNDKRQKFLSFGLLDKMTQGIAGGVDDGVIDNWVQDMLVARKLSARELASQDRDTLIRVNEAISRLPRTPVLDDALMALRGEIRDVQDNAQLWDAAGERKTVIEDMEQLI